MARSVEEASDTDSLSKDIKPFTLAHEFSRKLDIEPTAFKRYTGMQYFEQSKYVQVRFDEKQAKKWGSIDLIHITDVQFGHQCCKLERVIEYRDWVLKEPNRFVIFGGDMVDAAHIASPGGPYENLFKPQTQVYKFCEIFAPMAHRVVSFVGGNHERRANLYFGDLGTLLATLLRTPYSSGQQFVDIHFGDWKAFRVDNWHGKGAAQTPGAQLNMVYQHAMQSDANFVPVGHLHNAMCMFRWMRQRDGANMQMKFVKQGFGMSSSFLDWVGSYAEVMGMKATDVLMLMAQVEASGKWELRLR